MWKVGGKRKTCVFSAAWLAMACVWALSCDQEKIHPTVSSNVVGLDRLELHDRIAYRCGSYSNFRHGAPDPLSVHLVTMDASDCKIELASAKGKGFRGESVASLARKNSAIAAINGGFFMGGGKNEAVATGALKLGRLWYSNPPLIRGAVGWSEGGRQYAFGRISMKWQIAFDGVQFPIDRLNKERLKRGSKTDRAKNRIPTEQTAILYTAIPLPRLSAYTSGADVVIEHGKVTQILWNASVVPVPKNGFVYSVSNDSGLDVDMIKTGMQADISYQFYEWSANSNKQIDLQPWDKMNSVLSAGPLLVSKGQVIENLQVDRDAGFFHGRGFFRHRQPRSAIGVLENGDWAMVVVDGRNEEVSVGISLKKFARLLKGLGFQEALNLDGGGSSVLYFDGRVRNLPSGKPSAGEARGARPAPNAFIVVPR